MNSKATKKKKTKAQALQPEIILPDATLANKPQAPLDTLTPDLDQPSLTSTDPLARYLLEIRKYPLLTREDEQRLATRYQETKDPEIAEVLVTSNLRFVVKVAAEYTKFGAKLIDLIQEGNMGLMHAVREFNPYKGVRLITYAVWWIRGYIQEYLMKQYSMVRIGTTSAQRKLFYELQRRKDEFDRMGSDAPKQLSGRLGVEEKDVEMMAQRLSGRDVSLDQPINDEGTSRIIDLQTEGSQDFEEDLIHSEQIQLLKSKIESIRSDLSDREVFLLENRLLADEPLTLQEIGDQYGITREAVRQLENRLLEKIRSLMINEI